MSATLDPSWSDLPDELQVSLSPEPPQPDAATSRSTSAVLGAGSPGAPAPAAADAWSSRWQRLASAAGLAPDEPLLVALSGGADSVLLLHLLAAAQPRPPVLAVHVHHGLRGAEADADAAFCDALCRSLGFPFRERRLALDPEGPSLEARARRERYRVLLREARRSGHRTLVTGHHADDALETLLQRWLRGTDLAGLRGPRPRLELGPGGRLAAAAAPEVVEGTEGAEGAEGTGAPRGPRLRIVRPLLPLRREEVRRLLAERGLFWREDRSNEDLRFTRNRIRHAVLPLLRDVCGEAGLENLHAFGRAVEELEGELAQATAHLAWAPPAYARATRSAQDSRLGGVLPRRDLMRLARPLRRRVLWRLLAEGTALAPGRALLEAVLDDLGAARCTRHALPGGWILLLRAGELHLLPPAARRSLPLREARERRQLRLPFPGEERPQRSGGGPPRGWHELPVPGTVALGDGRRITAELVEPGVDAAPRHAGPAGRAAVELDAEGLSHRLLVRWPREGDRFHGLGAPGSKRLVRFLADRGIPREERPWVPLVLEGDEIVWVGGIEPAERRRLRASTRRRLRLTLEHAG